MSESDLVARMPTYEPHARTCTFEGTFSNTPVSEQKCNCGASARNGTRAAMQALRGERDLAVARADVAEADNGKLTAQRDGLKIEELPVTWGLLEPDPNPRARRLRTVREAPLRNVTPSWVAMRSILARADTLETARRGELVRDVHELKREVATLNRKLSDAIDGVPDLSGLTADEMHAKLIVEHVRQLRTEHNWQPIDTKTVAETVVDIEAAAALIARSLTAVSRAQWLGDQLRRLANDFTAAREEADKTLEQIR